MEAVAWSHVSVGASTQARPPSNPCRRQRGHRAQGRAGAELHHGSVEACFWGLPACGCTSRVQLGSPAGDQTTSAPRHTCWDACSTPTPALVCVLCSRGGLFRVRYRLCHCCNQCRGSVVGASFAATTAVCPWPPRCTAIARGWGDERNLGHLQPFAGRRHAQSQRDKGARLQRPVYHAVTVERRGALCCALRCEAFQRRQGRSHRRLVAAARDPACRRQRRIRLNGGDSGAGN